MATTEVKWFDAYGSRAARLACTDVTSDILTLRRPDGGRVEVETESDLLYLDVEQVFTVLHALYPERFPEAPTPTPTLPRPHARVALADGTVVTVAGGVQVVPVTVAPGGPRELEVLDADAREVAVFGAGSWTWAVAEPSAEISIPVPDNPPHARAWAF